MFRALFKLFHKMLVRKKGASGVLIIQPLPGIGDVIWYLPHMHAIADARGPVSLLTKPRSFADVLLKTDSSIAEVIWLERNPGKHSGVRGFFRLVGEIRKKNYAQAWILHGSSRYAWVTYLAGIPKTFGYGVRFQKYLLTESDCLLSKKQLAVHGIERANTLLQHAGICRENDPALRFDNIDFDITHVMQEHGLAEANTRRAAFAIGSSVPYKQWGSHNFAALASKLLANGYDQILLLGGPAEQEIVDEIIQRSGQDNRSFVVLLGVPLEQLALLLKHCLLCVGNDTGVLNIAAAVKITSFGLFGSTTPLQYSSYLHPIVPPGNQSVPDSKQQQKLNRMQEITVEQVFAQIVQQQDD